MSYSRYGSTEIALGIKPDIDNIYKYGENSSVGTVEVPIWDKATQYYWMQAPTKLQVVSTSVDDNTGGTGAFKIRVFGLDQNWMAYSEDVTLNGTTPVETQGTFIRCFRAYVLEADSRQGLAGNINIYTTGSPNNVVAFIQTAQNQTHMAIYTVGVGCKFLLDNADANVGQGKDATVKIVVKENITGNEAELVKATRFLYQNSFSRVYKTPRFLEPKTDIFMTGISQVSSVKVSASFEGRLFRI